MRTLMCGGAPIPETLIRTYQQRGLTFLQGYGLTEASPGALFPRAGEGDYFVAGWAGLTAISGTPCTNDLLTKFGLAAALLRAGDQP